MDKQQEQLETLKEIRTLMERSSRFISLNGFSGVIAGIAAIAGVAAAYIYLGISIDEPGYYKYIEGDKGRMYPFFLMVIILVLTTALLAATLLTRKKARQKAIPVWDATARRLLVNMGIPLAAGTLYCLVLLYHGYIFMIAPATLLFYGLALLNASKYTFNDIRFLGILEIVTGLAAALFFEYGLLIWVFGFGVLHIVYGISMYYKYEK